jgi:hypothetical protein
MRFFLPDSQDFVDPTFDFETERRSPDRTRQRDDVYAHELFSKPAYDGLLVSKATVDGFGGAGRYTLAQRHRLLREGSKRFFRTSLPIMGDCGAFSYVKDSEPPFSVDDVLSFYEECDFSLGMSVDHVILEYSPDWDSTGRVPRSIRLRQELTLDLANEFLKTHRKSRLRFKPIGVAQGWSPASYAESVRLLQRIGYSYIALGGMVPLKTAEIREVLQAVQAVRRPRTRLHLLGVTRVENATSFMGWGVASFDSTSPLRQAFKDKDDNYHTPTRTFSAIRVPQVEGNPKLQAAIRAGRVSQDHARKLELACLAALERTSRSGRSAQTTVELLHDYEQLFEPGRDNRPIYAEILSEQPWKDCKCEVCRKLGHHVMLLRGAERNRRRGLHNVWVFYRRLQRELAPSPPLRRVRSASMV